MSDMTWLLGNGKITDKNNKSIIRSDYYKTVAIKNGFL
jgi:hypothetical protein